MHLKAKGKRAPQAATSRERAPADAHAWKEENAVAWRRWSSARAETSIALHGALTYQPGTLHGAVVCSGQRRCSWSSRISIRRRSMAVRDPLALSVRQGGTKTSRSRSGPEPSRTMRNRGRAHELIRHFALGQQLQVLAPDLNLFLVAAGVFVRQICSTHLIANRSRGRRFRGSYCALLSIYRNGKVHGQMIGDRGKQSRRIREVVARSPNPANQTPVHLQTGPVRWSGRECRCAERRCQTAVRRSHTHRAKDWW